jgi:drug/metabolite transporter (DMT)-like permease
MPLTVMFIVLFAALLHASWNFFVKRTEDKFLSMTAVVLGHTPFAIIAIIFSPMPARESLPYVFVGAMFHVGYQWFLLLSYRIGDLSQVYPMARGASPLIVTVVSVIFLRVHFSWTEMAAVAVIAAGIMSLALSRRNDGMRNAKATFMALTTGCFIAAYSLVDGLGARKAGTALGFFGWLSAINTIVFVASMQARQPGIVARVFTRKWKLALGTGGASFLAFAMVMWSFTVVPIALVTALRETSIIFALLLGVFVLKERIDLLKLLATMLTVLGIVLLRFGG